VARGPAFALGVARTPFAITAASATPTSSATRRSPISWARSWSRSPSPFRRWRRGT